MAMTHGARTRSFAKQKWFGVVNEAKKSTEGIFLNE